MSQDAEGAVPKKFTILQQRRMVATEETLKKNGLSRFIPAQNCIFCPGSIAFSTPFRSILARHLMKKHQSIDRAIEQAGQIWETLSSEQDTLCQIHNINLDYLKVDEKSSSESDESGNEADDQDSEPLTEPEEEIEEERVESAPESNDDIIKEQIPEPVHECIDCSQKFASAVTLKRHIARYCRREIQCEHCSRVYKIKEGEPAKKFTKRVHNHRARCLISPRRLNPKPSSFMCEKCSKVFADSRRLKQHNKRCSIVYECQGCGTVYKKNAYKEMHQGKCRAFKRLQKKLEKSLPKVPGPKLVASATLRNPKDRFLPPRESDFVAKEEIEVKDEPLVSDVAESCDFIAVEDDIPAIKPAIELNLLEVNPTSEGTNLEEEAVMSSSIISDKDGVQTGNFLECEVWDN